MKIINKFLFELKSALIKFLRLFFVYIQGGQNCIICGSKTYVYPVCNKCVKLHFEINDIFFDNRCEKCGKELISTERICSKCKEQSILQSINKTIPLFSYRLWNKELLFMWKINGIRNLSFFFAELIYKAMKFHNYSVIVPVPPRQGKIKKKGWDQIDELCRILSKKYGFKVLKILKRLSKGEQKKLNREERLESMKNAYSLENGKVLEKEIARVGGKLPKSVCLIDDVCTTGATVESCGSILKKYGIEEVNAITLFVVD